MPQDESKLLRDLRVICNGGATTYKCHATVMRAAYPALQDLAGDCLIVAEASPTTMMIILEIAYYGRSEQELDSFNLASESYSQHLSLFRHLPVQELCTARGHLSRHPQH